MSTTRITQQQLDLFGKRVIQQARSNLTKLKKTDTKLLYNSLESKVYATKNTYKMVISGADHTDFIDKGVKGNKSSAKAPNSPYKFKDKAPPVDAIEPWVKRHRFQFTTKKGKFMSYRSTAFLVAKGIQSKGIETTNFLSKPFENEYSKLSELVRQSMAEDFKNSLKK